MRLSRGVGCGPISALMAAVVAALLAGSLGGRALAAQGEITPESTPVITDFNPKQATIGEEIKLMIEGKNFAPGVYVSFSTPLVHVVATERHSATRLEVAVRIGKKAEAEVISLYVSNTASVVAEAPFKIVPPLGPTVAPPEPDHRTSAPAQAAAPVTAPPSKVPAGAPEITRIDPPLAPRGGQVELKITGKNLGEGAKVVFSNPGIRVLNTQVSKETELVAHIQIRSDAAPGETNLFVVNPDEEEAEAAFVVSEEVVVAQAPVPSAPSAPASAPTPPAPAPTAPQASAEPAAAAKPAVAKAGAETLRFEVYGIADISAVLQARSKPKGTLSLEGGKLRFEEAGKEVFAVAASEVKEVEVNILFGMNTGTFHVILSSGQAYNFVATSLRPADSQAIVDSLKRALK